jgi:hypothetical protein
VLEKPVLAVVAFGSIPVHASAPLTETRLQYAFGNLFKTDKG